MVEVPPSLTMPIRVIIIPQPVHGKVHHLVHHLLHAVASEASNNVGIQKGEAVREERSGIGRLSEDEVTGNRFALGRRGGVFLYRNCGEDAVIRHQTPSDNQITDNVFTGAGWFRSRAVVVGSRDGNRPYCRDDRGWPFGSSLDDGDHATGNVVARNTVRR